MVTVTLSNSHIEIKGHAGFSEAGTDIVCAAVSALGQTLKHIDELHREYEVFEGKDGAPSILRVDFHNPKDLIKAYAIDRHKYLKKQLKKNKRLTMDERDEIQYELDNWDDMCRDFSRNAAAKALIIQNQVAIIVKGIKEIATDYPDHVEVVEVIE